MIARVWHGWTAAGGDADAYERFLRTELFPDVARLEGFGGAPPLDRLALHDLILRFARLLTDTPELVEADLNSVRVLPAGCLVLDARLRLTHPRSRPEPERGKGPRPEPRRGSPR